MLRHKPAKRFKIPGKLAALSAALLMFTSPLSMKTIEGVNSWLLSVPAPAQGAGTAAASDQQEEVPSAGSPARLGLNLSRMIFKLY